MLNKYFELLSVVKNDANHKKRQQYYLLFRGTHATNFAPTVPILISVRPIKSSNWKIEDKRLVEEEKGYQLVLIPA